MYCFRLSFVMSDSCHFLPSTCHFPHYQFINYYQFIRKLELMV